MPPSHPMPTSPPERLRRREIPQLPQAGSRLSNLPAWAISLLFHVVLLVVLGVLWTTTPKGTGGQPDRPAGIAVVHETAGLESYSLVDTTDDQEGATDQPSPAALSASLATASQMLASANAEALANLLPGAVDAGAASESAAGGVGLSGGGAGIGGSREVARVKTEVFGIEGEGTRFLYVFDRSASMNGHGGAPIREAKRELAKSIGSLGEAHQFQVIFYNEYPTAFGSNSPRGVQLLRGTDASKQDALRFIRDIVADGSTQHIDALRMGLSMSPDVLFFLTDADVPALSQRELDSVLDRASRVGATIHTIQFGSGSRTGGDWIEQLAVQTLGKYRYINVAAF